MSKTDTQGSEPGNGRAMTRARKLRIPKALDDRVVEYCAKNFRSDMNDTYMHLIREGARAVGIFGGSKPTEATRP